MADVDAPAVVRITFADGTEGEAFALHQTRADAGRYGEPGVRSTEVGLATVERLRAGGRSLRMGRELGVRADDGAASVIAGVYKANREKLEQAFLTAPIEEIPIASLHASQDVVSARKVADMVEHWNPGTHEINGNVVRAVKVGEKVYIDDGHHRVASASVLGAKMVRAKVVDTSSFSVPADLVVSGGSELGRPPVISSEKCGTCGEDLGANFLGCSECAEAMALDEVEGSPDAAFSAHFDSLAAPQIEDGRKPETSGPFKNMVRGKPFAWSPIGDPVIALDGREAVLPLRRCQSILMDARSRKQPISVTSMHEKGPQADKILGKMVPSSLRIDGQMMVCDEVYWTQPTAKSLELQEYGPISPDFFHLRKPEGNRVFPGKLRNVSLVPIAAFHEMDHVTLGARASNNTPPPVAIEKEKPMSLTAEVAELLGLPLDATEDQVKAAKASFAALRAKPAPVPVPTQVGMTETEMKAYFDKREAERSGFEAKKARVSQLLDDAQGKDPAKPAKITAAQRASFQSLGETNPDQLEAVLKSMPALEGQLGDDQFTAEIDSDAGGADTIQLTTQDYGTRMFQLADELGVDLEVASRTLRSQGFRAIAPPTQAEPNPQLPATS